MYRLPQATSLEFISKISHHGIVHCGLTPKRNLKSIQNQFSDAYMLIKNVWN